MIKLYSCTLTGVNWHALIFSVPVMHFLFLHVRFPGTLVSIPNKKRKKSNQELESCQIVAYLKRVAVVKNIAYVLVMKKHFVINCSYDFFSVLGQ